MKMKLRNVLLLLLIIFNLSCSKQDDIQDDIQDPDINKDFYLATTLIKPSFDILFDTEKNLIYFFELDRYSDGHYNFKIVCYNYENYEVVCEIEKNFSSSWVDMAYSDVTKEIYISMWKTVYIFNSESLKLIDSIHVFDEQDPRFVASLDFQSSNLLFIGPGNQALDPEKKGSIVFNRSNKQKISESTIGNNMQRIKTYIEDENTIGVLSPGSTGSQSLIILDKYDMGGNFLEFSYKYHPYGSISSNLLSTNKATDFFITSDEGNIFSKLDLSFIKSLNGDYRDIIINEEGNLLYCITWNKTVEVIDYPNLDVLEIIPTNETASATTGFIDGKELILVYFITNKVYMSKIEIL